MKCWHHGLYLLHFIFSHLGTKKLEGYIALVLKGLPRTNNLAYCVQSISNGENKDKGDMSRK